VVASEAGQEISRQARAVGIGLVEQPADALEEVCGLRLDGEIMVIRLEMPAKARAVSSSLSGSSLNPME